MILSFFKDMDASFEKDEDSIFWKNIALIW